MEDVIHRHLEEGKLPCKAAFAIAGELRVKPLLVGQKADEMGIKISQCQLGLFGYGSKEEGSHRIVRPLENIPPAVKEKLEQFRREGKITCAGIWAIASKLGISKLEVAGAAEALGIQIIQCQLGCF